MFGLGIFKAELCTIFGVMSVGNVLRIKGEVIAIATIEYITNLI